MLKKLLVTISLSSIIIGSYASDKIVMDGSTTVGPIAKAFAEYYMQENPEVNIIVSESGSGNGAKSLVNGTCDIANMSRFMKTKEVKAAVDNGITPVAHIVAMDGLPILVHPSNPVKNISIKQIRDIYTGKILNWKELGGPNKKIVMISRDTNSGTYETFKKLILAEKKDGKKIKHKIIDGCEYVGSNGGVRQRVQSTPGSIGYAGLGFVDDTVKALTVNGIEANVKTVSLGEYPISRPLFMFTNGIPKLGTHLHKFINLYRYRKGQEIIEAIGFVSTTEY